MTQLSTYDLTEKRCPAGAVCYVIDAGYLLPTLVSALQVRKFTSRALADVIIICLDKPSELVSAATSVAEANGVEIVLSDKSILEGRHIMYGRLFLDKLIAPEYSRIVYIDGDTQVRGPLDELFIANLDSGQILAVRDPVMLFTKISPRIRKKFRDHVNEIGITDPDRYFNSGLLVISRAGWPELAARALKIADSNAGRFKYPDQDALNLAALDDCKLIANRWNFPGFLINSAAEAQSSPRVYHFMSNPRPWNEAVAPWGALWKKPYLDFLATYPSLVSLTPRSSGVTKARYVIQQFAKMAISYHKVGGLKELPPEVEL